VYHRRSRNGNRAGDHEGEQAGRLHGADSFHAAARGKNVNTAFMLHLAREEAPWEEFPLPAAVASAMRDAATARRPEGSPQDGRAAGRRACPGPRRRDPRAAVMASRLMPRARDAPYRKPSPFVRCTVPATRGQRGLRNRLDDRRHLQRRCWTPRPSRALVSSRAGSTVLAGTVHHRSALRRCERLTGRPRAGSRTRARRASDRPRIPRNGSSGRSPFANKNDRNRSGPRCQGPRCRSRLPPSGIRHRRARKRCWRRQMGSPRSIAASWLT